MISMFANSELAHKLAIGGASLVCPYLAADISVSAFACFRSDISETLG